MGNVCCAARGDGVIESTDEYRRDGIEVFTEAASPLAQVQEEEVRLSFEKDRQSFDAMDFSADVLSKSELETQFRENMREYPGDIINLGRYSLFLAVIRQDSLRSERTLRDALSLAKSSGVISPRLRTVQAHFYWLRENDPEKAERCFKDAASALGTIKDVKTHLHDSTIVHSDYALFLESIGREDEARRNYKKCLVDMYGEQCTWSAVADGLHKDNLPRIHPVVLCNYAFFEFRTEPHNFDIAENYFLAALRSTTKRGSLWNNHNRGMFAQHAMDIFVAVFTTKILTLDAHGDQEWEVVFRRILQNNNLDNIDDFYHFDMSKRLSALLVEEEFQMYTPFVVEKQLLPIVSEAETAIEEYAAAHPGDARARWRHAMVLGHCTKNAEAAMDEFKAMLDCEEIAPPLEAVLDAAMFFAENMHLDLAEKTFMRAYDSRLGHSNARCLALLAIFYHHKRVNLVKSRQFLDNAMHADPHIDTFLEARGLRVD